MARGPLALLRWTCLSLLLFVHAAHCFYLLVLLPKISKCMFFKQFLAFFGIHQMALCLFRFIAALGRTEVVGNTLGTFTLLMCGVALRYEDFGN
ncbi:Pleiotropic drug resistance protein 2 [Morella rubra]|uniref:Pleiotropic drug resistance protein 2 n=1 Tax=Morella rubra TaxID=262757 RepID=A0A6A1VJ41_9ROSI|nr:Pleiotropic drug resistance protein 2 [Morella rubra]